MALTNQSQPSGENRRRGREPAEGLFALFATRFCDRNWSGRYELLGHIFGHLSDNIQDRAAAGEAFATLVEQLLNRVPVQSIGSDEQAHIYAASGGPHHRGLAEAWFATGEETGETVAFRHVGRRWRPLAERR